MARSPRRGRPAGRGRARDPSLPPIPAAPAGPAAANLGLAAFGRGRARDPPLPRLPGPRIV